MTGELPAIGYAERPAAVRASLDGATLIVSTPSNIRWLTGFGGTLAWVVIGPERLVLVTDGRYAERATADLQRNGVDGEVVVAPTRPKLRDLVVAAATSPRPVRAEASHLPHAMWSDLATEITLEPDAGTIVKLRRVKDEGELARIARAAEIA